MEVDSDTEAVISDGFKLGCIYCKMRGEVDATATVKWSFKGSGDSDFSDVRFYHRIYKEADVIHGF